MMSKIMVVDDDVQIRGLLDKGFSRQGNTVVPVPDLAQALTKVGQEDFDLVILDLILGKESGITFLEKIRKAKSDLPIIVFSGAMTSDMELDLRKAGANEVIRKGGEVSELFRQSEKILEAGKRLFIEPTQERTLLVIDDDESIRGLLNQFFSRKKYRVLEAETGAKGLEIIGKDKITSVLLDVNMPGESGVDILPKIFELDPTIGVVMVSGEGDERMVKKALELGAYGYIMKPFDFVYLELTVASKLAIAGSHR